MARSRAPAPSPCDLEAAAWFAKLQQPVIPQAELRRLRAWRLDPQNDAAFRRQEKVWRSSGALRGDIDVQRAVQKALRARPHRRRGLLAAGVGAIASSAILAVVFAPSLLAQHFVTHVGEQRLIQLADGSAVRLDADSRLTVRLERRARRLILERGQAYFEVAHDGARPFVVSAGETTVTATGTRFEVRPLAAAPSRVVLIQGSVVVRAPSPQGVRTWRLEPAQQIADTSKGVGPQPVDTEAALGWTSGRLVFHDTPLAEVLAEANRHSVRPLRLADDPALEQVRVDGVFKAGDSADLSQALAALYGLSVEDRGRDGLVLRPTLASPKTPARHTGSSAAS